MIRKDNGSNNSLFLSCQMGLSDGAFFMIKHTPLPNGIHPILSPICPMGVADTLEPYLNYELFQIFHPTLHSNSTTVSGEEKCQAVIARNVGSRFDQLISREKNWNVSKMKTMVIWVVKFLIELLDNKNLFMFFCTIFSYVILWSNHNNLRWKYCLLF